MIKSNSYVISADVEFVHALQRVATEISSQNRVPPPILFERDVDLQF